MKAELDYSQLCPLVSMRKLEFVLGFKRGDLRRLAAEAEVYYRPFEKIDKISGKRRKIDNPGGLLKKIQAKIKKCILDKVPLPLGVLGGVKGRSIRDNLAWHTRQKLVTCIDIKECFPTISDQRVHATFIRVLRCSNEIAALLTKLTTYQHRLPQGAPTSTTLAALVLSPLFHELEQLVRPLDLKVTLWVDDVTISGREHRAVLGPAIALLRRYGFAVRNKKVKVISRSSCQFVTGGVVNSGPSIGQKRRREYRKFIMAADPSSASDRMKVTSRISFARQVNCKQAATLERLWQRRVCPEP